METSNIGDTDLYNKWLFESFQKYSSLHMYFLQTTPHCLEWITDSSLCVVCNGGLNSEILELELPSKLTCATANEGLCKDRDFHMVCGGFSQNPVSGIRCIPDTRRIVTLEEYGDLSFRQLGTEESDVICVCSTIESKDRECKWWKMGAMCSGMLAYGNYLKNQPCGSAAIAGVEFWNDPDTLLTCEQKSGRIHVLSCKDQLIASSTPDTGLCNNTVGFTRRNQYDVLTVSSSGLLLSWDLRSTSEPTVKTFLDAKTVSYNSTPGVFLRVSPTNANIISVSGLNASVSIYDIESCTSSSCQPLPCVIAYDGHQANAEEENMHSVMAINHQWHPVKENLLVSSGSDASLHAWIWNHAQMDGKKSALS